MGEKNEQIKEMGAMDLDNGKRKHHIKLITIIGEIEGHEAVSGNTKATKYEHLLPMLAEIEDSTEIEGLLILLNTLGGDVEAGLSIAEMIASLSKPTVSLVLGGSHSIGGPLAVSADYSFIVPSGTMIIHPVRSSGMFIGVMQSFKKYGKDTGSNYKVSCKTFTYETTQNRGVDAESDPACERCGNPS